MNQTTQEKNKALVLHAFDTLFNKRDHAAAEKLMANVHRPTPTFTRENCGGESRPCAATSEAQRAGLLLPARAFFASLITRCSISRGISS
jgi:hypothetical protein